MSMLLCYILVEVLATGLIQQAGAQVASYGIMTTTPAPGIGQRRRRQINDGCLTAAGRNCQSTWLDLLDTFSNYVWNEASFVYVGTGRAAGADCTSIKEGFEEFRQCMALEGCCDETFEKKKISAYLVNISAEILIETTRKRSLCKFTKLTNDCSAPDYTSLMMAIVVGGLFLAWNSAAFFCHRRAKRQHAPEQPELGILSLLCFVSGAPIACCFPIDGPGSEIIASMRKAALQDGMRVEAQGLAEPGHWGWGKFELYDREGGDAALHPAAAAAPKQHPDMTDGNTSSREEPSSPQSPSAKIPGLPTGEAPNLQKERQIASSSAARAFYERKEYEKRKAAEAAARGEGAEEAGFANFVKTRSERQPRPGLPGQLP